MQILIMYLRKEKGLLAAALILAAINQIFSLLDPLIFRHVIDRYATKYDQYGTGDFLQGVSLLLGAAVGVALVSRIAKNFQDYYVSHIVQRTGAALYTDGIRHSLDLPYDAFEDQRSGETLGKLNKARTDIERFLNAAVNIVYTTLIGFVFVMVYAASVHWAIAPVYLATILILSWVSITLGQKIKVAQRKIVAETTSLAGATTESLRNIELVKSLGLAAQETARLNATSERILGLELSKVKTLRALSFLQGTIVNLLRTSILFLMLWLIFSQDITVGQFFALWIYSFFLFTPLQEFGNVLNIYRETEASLENYAAILAAPREPRPMNPVDIAELTELEFAEVKFQHRSASAPALDGVSFKVQRGETIAFVGPSGSGKTTLVKMLVGLYRPASGEVRYNGVSSLQVDLERMRERIGLVTQDPQLFSGSIRDNLRFVRPDASDDECLLALSSAAADSLLRRADQGLDTVIGEGGIKVSGGERQRLAIARALLRRPHLLVFDEATSALDSLTEEEVSRTIRDVSLRSSAITILVAHRLSTVMHADRIYVLERGSVVETGTHEELVAGRGLYYAMWRQQVGETQPAKVGAHT
jgi:ATP-binding cassette subfamily B protein